MPGRVDLCRLVLRRLFFTLSVGSHLHASVRSLGCGERGRLGRLLVALRLVRTHDHDLATERSMLNVQSKVASIDRLPNRARRCVIYKSFRYRVRMPSISNVSDQDWRRRPLMTRALMPPPAVIV